MLSLLLTMVDETMTMQSVADRIIVGSTLWAVGCLGGASMRAVGQWVRGR